MLVLAQYFPPDLGGSATRAYNIAKGLALNGCRVTVVAAFPHYPHGNIPKEYRWKPFKVEWMGGLKVIRTLMPPIRSEGFFKRLVLIAFFAVSSLFAFPLVGKVDAVWTSSWAPGLVYSRVKRKPLALNEDDLTLEDLVDLKLMDEGSLVLGIAEWVYRFFLVKGDVVTPISQGYVETLAKKYCVERNRIHVVRGGVDLSVFRPAKREPGEKFTVLYSGAFSVAYDFEQIFRAAKIVEEKCGGVEFVVQGMGELLGSMRSTLDGLSVKSVRIVDKLLSREGVAKLLGEADVLVLPLVERDKPYQGMSSKLYEYQAVGRPIICCSRGLPKDHVKETKSGLAVYPGDAEALAKAVIELKENPELAWIMGENGRKYVENEASIESVGSKMKEIFKKLT
ncbi:glycosyltransferase family 4 protein [Candidatus Bathyarchaeota archaeon]|nr:glycosyltransferase family 4 protein [Candidatus Bathyarchaeota archaeon]